MYYKLIIIQMIWEDYRYGLLCFRKRIMGELNCTVAQGFIVKDLDDPAQSLLNHTQISI